MHPTGESQLGTKALPQWLVLTGISPSHLLKRSYSARSLNLHLELRSSRGDALLVSWQAALPCSLVGPKSKSQFRPRASMIAPLRSTGTPRLYHVASEALVRPRAAAGQGIFTTRAYTAQGDAMIANPFSHHLLWHSPIR